MDLYEHAVEWGEWERVREGMLGGGRGQHSVVTWYTLEREVSGGCGLSVNPFPTL